MELYTILQAVHESIGTLLYLFGVFVGACDSACSGSSPTFLVMVSKKELKFHGNDVKPVN